MSLDVRSFLGVGTTSSPIGNTGTSRVKFPAAAAHEIEKGFVELEQRRQLGHRLVEARDLLGLVQLGLLHGSLLVLMMLVVEVDVVRRQVDFSAWAPHARV